MDASPRSREVLREVVTVDRPPETAWDHLARLERWPSWAGHIRSMEPEPSGRLTATTEVDLTMTIGVRSRMAVTSYDPPRSWVWEGWSPGVATVFEHRLEPAGIHGTRIWFLAWMRGVLAPVIGPVFGAMMSANLDRALPRLRDEIEALP